MSHKYQQRLDGITIAGPSKEDIETVSSALSCLRTASPEAHKRVARHLALVLIVPDIDQYNELLVEQGAWIAGQELVQLQKHDPAYLASLLVHEEKHIAQFREGRSFRGDAAEREAYAAQRSFLKEIRYDEAVRWLDEQLDAASWHALDAQANHAARAHRAYEAYVAVGASFHTPR